MKEVRPIEPVVRGCYPVLNAMRLSLTFWVTVDHYRMIPPFVDPATASGCGLERSCESRIFAS